jgi:predicted MPP superfamily phosphohydrolase
VGPTIKYKYLKSIVDVVNTLNPDMVAITGDLVDGSVTNLSKHTVALTNLKSKHGSFFVLGNHEYYKGAYPKTLIKIKDAASNSNIHVLENESLEIDHVCFHGCTLWTDFSLKGNPAAYGALCQSRMNDYKKIRLGDNYAKLRSIDTFRIHQTSRQWLEHSLSVNQAKHNIVVTHHAPSIRSLPMKYLDDPISAAYASDMEDFIIKHQPSYWIHGHIHTPANYKIGNTDIICNPHGYINEPYNGFNKDLIIEI